MYFTYVICNPDKDKIYIGFTSDVRKRLAKHNSDKNSGWTKRYQPWILLFSEEYETRTEAAKREKYLKSHAGREKVRHYINKNIQQ